MNIQRKAIPMEIDGKEYEFILDFESAIEFQGKYGDSIFVGLSKLSEKQDLYAMACLIAFCLKDSTGKCVGLDFVKKLDLINGLDFFMDKLSALMDNSLPEEDDNAKKNAKKK